MDNSSLSHALILTGGTDESRRAEAVSLAASLLCEKAALPGVERGVPCQPVPTVREHSQFACSSCRKVYAFGHPDVTFLEPEKSEIVVGQVRGLRAVLQMAPVEGDCKIAVIHADALNLHAQNALLGILEEPPGRAYFFLLSENPSILLSTVRSRCAVKRIEDRGQRTENSSEAQTLMDALLSGDEWVWARACLSMEKSPRDRLRQILNDLAALLVRDMPGRDILTARRFGGIIDQIRVYTDMLEANVGAGHVCGSLAAAGGSGQKAGASE